MKKFFSVLITVSMLLIMLVAVCGCDTSHDKVYIDFADLSVEEVIEKAKGEDNFVSVFIRFNYPTMDSSEVAGLDKNASKKVEREYYKSRSEEIALRIGLGFEDLVESAPFVEIVYQTAEEFYKNKSFIYKMARDDGILWIWVALASIGCD